MRYTLALILTVLTLCAGAVTSVEAQGYRYHRHCHHHYGRYLAHRHYAHVSRHWHRVHHDVVSRSDRPGCFYTAAAMGGPCGCYAASLLLHIEAHVWHGINLWLAQDWADKFPHVPVAEATAFVWPHRHVAAAVPGSYREGTVVVRDSWATHRVRVAGLIPVDPLRSRSRSTYRFEGAVPL
jgi:hypothetical protein